ncbi:MAG: HU family DNA-binding protein [Bacteroidaceae bacterium]|nr:HU family DNA-binding protein [Bacteroidaceae bacterium]MBR3532115.1 HU family DNA-binding protein [Bacteroidaceae bacterium]
MNNKEFAMRLAKKTGLSAQQIADLQNAFIDSVVSEVRQGNVVSLQGFGNFELKEKAARKMYNPTTQETVIIPARYTLGYKPSNTLKDKIKG